MNQGLARLLSYTFHPAVMPVIGVVLIFEYSPYYTSTDMLYFTMLFAFTGTYLLPALVSVVLVKLGVVGSLEMKDAKDRRIPFLVAAVFFYLTASGMRDLPLPPQVYYFLLGSSMSIIIAFLFLQWMKVSAHTAGVSGLLAMLMVQSLLWETDMSAAMIAVVLVAGILASARLRLEAHTFTEIVLGFCCGFIPVFSIMYYLGVR